MNTKEAERLLAQMGEKEKKLVYDFIAALRTIQDSEELTFKNAKEKYAAALAMCGLPDDQILEIISESNL